MQACCHNQDHHTNAFVTVNSLPYLLGEYVDRKVIQPVDRSMIKSEVKVDTTEPYRAIIDVSVDDIGIRASDGLPNIIGNNTKKMALLDMIRANFQTLDHHLPVLKPGLVVRVNARLENNRTGQVIRSMIEDIPLENRNYFLDVNPRDINDNAVIVNFSKSLCSTVNQFTHGRDTMIFRITSLQLCYPCVMDDPLRNRVGGDRRLDPYHNPIDMYEYHDHMQSHIDMSYHTATCHQDDIMPPYWESFERFYHFDKKRNDIILHKEEINDPNTKVAYLSCGNVQVNRAFLVNPGHRIVYKFSIWKNDVTLVNDVSAVANVLRAPVSDPYYVSPCTCCHNDKTNQPYGIYPDMENVLKMYKAGQNMDYTQNAVINQLNDKIDKLSAAISALQPSDGSSEEENTGGSTQEDPVPILPTLPSPPERHRYHKDRYDAIMQMLQSLQNQINELKPAPEENETGNGTETPTENQTTKPDIQDIVNNADQNSQPGNQSNTENTNTESNNNTETPTENNNTETPSGNETNTETPGENTETNP